MALPADVQAALEKMQQAEAALRTDIQEGEYDSKRRRRLLDDVRHAMGDYLNKIARLPP